MSVRSAGRFILCLLWILLVQLPRPASADPSPLRIKLHILNHADVPAETLTEASEGVLHIFGEIGLEVAWNVFAGEDFEPLPWDRTVPLFRIVIVRSPATGADVRHGTTAGLAQKESRLAMVFFERVASVSRSLSRGSATAPSDGRLLACIIAHEIGHLLLPEGQRHSEAGLMRAGWNLSDMEDAATGQFGFSSEQGAVIRSLLHQDAGTEPLIP